MRFWEVVLNVKALEALLHRRPVGAVAWVSMLAVGVGALPAGASELAKAVADGALDLSLRYRLEHVDQDGFDEKATASTAKARLSWTSGARTSWQNRSGFRGKSS